MYFIQEGIVGIAFSLISHGFGKRSFKVSMRQKDRSIMADHYVIN